MTAISTGRVVDVEIRLRLSGAVWTAELLERTGTLITVRLHPGELGVLPMWPAGTAVDCALLNTEGHYYAEAAVETCSGDEVVLRLLGEEMQTERRQTARAIGWFPVAYSTPTDQGTAACIDIGEGGIRIHAMRSMQAGEGVSLAFNLPGEAQPVSAQGTVVRAAPAGERDGWYIGMQFADLAPADRDAIARYCRTSVIA